MLKGVLIPPNTSTPTAPSPPSVALDTTALFPTAALGSTAMLYHPDLFYLIDKKRVNIDERDR